ncbi:fimbrial protein [Nissabacter sp. SGAir0207]|uniref:fimbrial protein n=1 Tax=Nissabacter sp. SGAir0207 TaxID=2126321 RepID=UPI0010CD2A59|nr:fimbrial protein [Nissabacter sp. SGAir0207]QCR35763.1 fimbrial protein [Nissabacter sp. SGAir0207]
MVSFKKSLLCLAASTLLVAGGALADAGQGEGKITFKGVVIDAPCSISPDSVDMEVNLGEVSTDALKSGTSAPISFDIKLQDCQLDDGTGTPVATKVGVTFNSANVDPSAANILANTRGLEGAHNVGVRLMKEDESHIDLGVEQDVPLVGMNDVQVLTFKAHMESLPSGLPTPGAVEANATYVLNYL